MVSGAGLANVRVRGFRSARDVRFSPGRLCALVGEASTGKSNLLAALWALLDPSGPAPSVDDLPSGGDGTIVVEAELADGGRLALEARPPASPLRSGRPPDVLFLPAAERGGQLVAPPGGRGGDAVAAAGLFAAARDRTGTTTAAAATALVAGVEACCDAAVARLVLLVEEPELYLRPQAQRYLYRLFHTLADAGNQVVYSTHAPAFLNVGRIEELVLVTHDPDRGTRAFQPKPLPADVGFRAMSEFDAERSELFLARAAVLVEGRTEKLVLPFVFRALGRDHDREAITIVECGGKPNIPVFAHVCDAVGVPYVVVHDRDASRGKQPIAAERAVNELIRETAGDDRIVVLEPDFEAVAGLGSRSHKPAQAWRRFASLGHGDVPAPLLRVAELALELARGR